jgi:hypothetical protein
MIELYFAPISNKLEDKVMLEECGLPYRVCPVNLTRGDAKARKSLFGASAGSMTNLKEDQPVAEIGKRT